MHARPGHILIVDDDPLNRRLLAKNLDSDGHRTMDVDNGFAALTAIGTGQPDLVLLDIQMPGLDGIEVLERIKTDACDPPHPGDHDLGDRGQRERRAVPRSRRRRLPPQAVRPSDPPRPDRRGAEPETTDRPRTGPRAGRLHSVPPRAHRCRDADAERRASLDRAGAPLRDGDVRRPPRVHHVRGYRADRADRLGPQPLPGDDGRRGPRPRRNRRRLPRRRADGRLRSSDRDASTTRTARSRPPATWPTSVSTTSTDGSEPRGSTRGSGWGSGSTRGA